MPEDERRLLLRVWLDDDWSGDLLFGSSDARSTFLDALTAGEISVVRRRIPLTDACGELDIAPATRTGEPGPRSTQNPSPAMGEQVPQATHVFRQEGGATERRQT